MVVKKKRLKESINNLEFVISKSELNDKKNDTKTFNPFGVTDRNTEENKAIFKSSWGMYGLGNPSESVDKLNLVNKYKPQKLSDIIGNTNNIKQFQNWLHCKFEKSKTYDYAVITGESGSGKSEFIRQCFKDLNFSLIEYDQSINKAEMETIQETIRFTSIELLLSGKKEKGIIIDNFQNNLSTTQLTELLKILKKYKSSPTIFMSSNNSKLLDVLNGNVLHIEYEIPTKKQLLILGRHICKSESLNITDNALKKFIKSSSYDLRGFLSTLTFIASKDSKINVDEDNLQSILKSAQKDIKLDIENTMDMFVNPNSKLYLKNNIDCRSRYTSMHTSGLIQENYLTLLKKDTSIEELSELSDIICEADILKKYMVSKPVWELSDIVSFVGTEVPAYVIRNNYKPIKKYKVPNRFDSFKSESNKFGLPIQDICFSISKIYFKLEPTAKWIKQMKKSSEIFRKFMLSQYINKDTAIKIIGMSYIFDTKNEFNDPGIIKKIKTKFRNEWKLIES